MELLLKQVNQCACQVDKSNNYIGVSGWTIAYSFMVQEVCEVCDHLLYVTDFCKQLALSCQSCQQVLVQNCSFFLAEQVGVFSLTCYLSAKIQNWEFPLSCYCYCYLSAKHINTWRYCITKYHQQLALVVAVSKNANSQH